MNFILLSPETGKKEELTLPCSEDDFAKYCQAVGVKNSSETMVTVERISQNTDLYLLIGGQTCKLEELNFLLKGIKSLKSEEKDLFLMASHANAQEELPFFINLVFNLQCFSVISDFSYLHLIGRALHLNESDGVEENFDNTAFFLQSLQEGKFKITSKGVVFYDDTLWKDHFVQGHFPYLPHKNEPLTLCITKGEQSEFLNLPTSESALFKVFERLVVSGLQDCTMELLGLEQMEAVETIAKKDFSFNNCNKIAKAFVHLREDQKELLNQLVNCIKIQTFTALTTLISCIDHFSINQGIKTAEEYGKHLVKEQNRLKFDETLGLYIDFHSYGDEVAKAERGVFTDSGYLEYQGYDPEMGAILAETIGYYPRNRDNSCQMKLYFPLYMELLQGVSEMGAMISGDGKEEKSEKFMSVFLPYIQQKLLRFHEELGESRGFMGQYLSRDSINAKVEKYIFSAEQVETDLYGVAILDLNDALSKEELGRLKQIIGGHAAGSINESLRKEIFEWDSKEIEVSLWNSSFWFLKTEEEFQEGRGVKHG